MGGDDADRRERAAQPAGAAGIAALATRLKRAHPDWRKRDLKRAIFIRARPVEHAAAPPVSRSLIADPAAHGRLKAELVRIVEEQRGSDISQAFVIAEMHLDPKALTSTVSGTLKTFVGAQVIASQRRSFRFRWSKRGLSLALAGFEQLPTDKEEPGQ